jgi:glutathione synthase (EC 6.3.2.3)
MRKDPPFDQEYIYATYLLERAESMGVYVINKPQSLRDANEKLFTAWFPQCCAETLVAREPARIRDFLLEQGEIILKPLDGMGGTSIFHLRQNDPNLSVILETMTQYNSRYVMAQKYCRKLSTAINVSCWLTAKSYPMPWRVSPPKAKPGAIWRRADGPKADH